MNDFLRDKREREFQTKVLAALEKPTERTFWKTINSPFILWALSAILVSTISGFIASSNSCTTEAERLIETHDQIRSELEERYRRIRHIALAASTMDEALSLIDLIPSGSTDFRNRSTGTLYLQAIRILQSAKPLNMV